MISISGPALLAAQALKVVTKIPVLHALSPLLKIATIKNSNADILQKNKCMEKMNISIDKSDPIQVDLAAKFKRTIKDFQLNPRSIIDKYNIVREGGGFWQKILILNSQKLSINSILVLILL